MVISEVIFNPFSLCWFVLGDTKGRKGGFKGETNCFRIIKMIMERNFAPVIVFSFSKKDCEAYALQMTKLEFNTKVCRLCYSSMGLYL